MIRCWFCGWRFNAGNVWVRLFWPVVRPGRVLVHCPHCDAPNDTEEQESHAD